MNNEEEFYKLKTSMRDYWRNIARKEQYTSKELADELRKETARRFMYHRDLEDELGIGAMVVGERDFAQHLNTLITRNDYGNGAKNANRSKK